MALHTVLYFPDPRLRIKAKRVDSIDEHVQQLINDMFETMYAHNGVGLAATQINIPLRLVVVDYSNDRSAPHCLINPEILHRSGEQVSEEGCLSVPGHYDKVIRAAQIKLRFMDPEGEIHDLAIDGHLAACYQHEIDHLDGKLFIDYLSRLKQQRIRERLEKVRHSTL